MLSLGIGQGTLSTIMQTTCEINVNNPEIAVKSWFMDFTLLLSSMLSMALVSCFVCVYSYKDIIRFLLMGGHLVVVSASGGSEHCCCCYWWDPLGDSGQCNGVHYMYRCNTVHQTLSQDINITALTFPENQSIGKSYSRSELKNELEVYLIFHIHYINMIYTI